MPGEITRQQFFERYEKLPLDLQAAIYSKENSLILQNIAEENKIAEKKPEIGRYVGRVLMGFLTPEELVVTLEKEVGLEKKLAEKVAKEIDEKIFSKVAVSLERICAFDWESIPSREEKIEALKQISIEKETTVPLKPSLEKPIIPPSPRLRRASPPEETKETPLKPAAPRQKDSYREMPSEEEYFSKL